MTTTKGILIFAHNNEEIDYFKLAVINAYYIKENLDIHDITVVTNKFSYDYNVKNVGKEFIDNAVSNIVFTEKDKAFKNANRHNIVEKRILLVIFFIVIFQIAN